ncbi:MAG: hypothetical protein NTV44_04695 [Firmicutes bacterium]|nr:hypothetical protein [Bacillota bacterium]
MMIKLTELEMAHVIGGEIITLTAVMAILVIAIAAVIVYRLFMSSKGSASIPGGFKFEWA